MSKISPVQYVLLSIFNGRPRSVGIHLEKDSRTPEYVRIPVEPGAGGRWTTTSPQIVPGPIRLSVRTFYTMEQYGQVYATNERSADKEWYLAPGKLTDTYIICTDRKMASAWTVVDEKIVIAPVDSDPDSSSGQLFQFYVTEAD